MSRTRLHQCGETEGCGWPVTGACRSERGGAVTIKDIQDAVRELHAQHDWPIRTPESRALWLCIEVGELLHEVQQYGWYPDRADEIRARASHEMYDVMWNLVDLATIMGIDLEQAFAEKARMNRERRWPQA